MKSARRWYRRNPTATHTAIALVIAATLIALSVTAPPRIAISEPFLQTLAAVAGTLTGFTILATMLLPNLWQHPSLTLLARHPARSRETLATFSAATRTLGLTTLVALAALVLEPAGGVPYRIAAGAVILTATLATVRVAEVIWLTQQIASVIVTAQNRVEQPTAAYHP